MSAEKKDDCYGKLIDRMMGSKCKDPAPTPAPDPAPAPAPTEPVECKAVPCTSVPCTSVPCTSTPCGKCKGKVVEKKVIQKVPVYVDKIKYIDREKTVEKEKIVEKVVNNKNEIYFLVGTGPDALNYKMEGRDGRDIQLRKEYGIFFGIGYDRLVTDSISLGVGVMSNESYFGKAGVHF
jgi:hypothetical protein